MKENLERWLVYAFWNLPYDLRRNMFPLIRPNTYKLYQQLRDPDNQHPKSLHAFDQHKCIFVHVPKTAGKSISFSMFDNWVGHMNILKYQLVFPKQAFNNYFKFAFVRNPYDRLVSAFHFIQGHRAGDGYQWARANLRDFVDFDSFVRGWVTKENVLLRLPFEPQHRFICDKHDQILVDFVGRYENLEQDFAYVTEKLQINTELQHRNRSNLRKRNYREYYTQETKRIVAEVYQRDFEILGYDIN